MKIIVVLLLLLPLTAIAEELTCMGAEGAGIQYSMDGGVIRQGETFDVSDWRYEVSDAGLVAQGKVLMPCALVDGFYQCANVNGLHVLGSFSVGLGNVFTYTYWTHGARPDHLEAMMIVGKCSDA